MFKPLNWLIKYKEVFTNTIKWFHLKSPWFVMLCLFEISFWLFVCVLSNLLSFLSLFLSFFIFCHTQTIKTWSRVEAQFDCPGLTFTRNSSGLLSDNGHTGLFCIMSICVCVYVYACACVPVCVCLCVRVCVCREVFFLGKLIGAH